MKPTTPQPGDQPLDPESETNATTPLPGEPQGGSSSATLPALPDDAAGEPEPDPVAEQTAPTPTDPAPARRSLAGSTWAALIVGLLLLILLLVFILQNQQQVELNLFAWSFEFPAGVAYLFSAIVGALITALVGGVRMIELSRQLRKLRKQQKVG